MVPGCRVFGRLGCTLVAVGLAVSASRAEDGSSPASEAEKVLRAASAVEPYAMPGSTPCRISSKWSMQAIPMGIAAEVFGVRVRADLVAPEPVPESTVILAAVEPDPARLCSDGEMRRQRGQVDAEAPVGTRYDTHVWEYSFPVFDAAFTKAIVVWTDLYTGSKKGVAGMEGTGVGATVTALAFFKRGRAWRLVKREVIGQT